ncbi:hypothetical protein TRFO_04821 [Tritrichomonas foetus]|uniref:Cullin family profile domain-containing protein n=1 Tax=Tritrichomonas foetus TaxID=1144522 RepID=A0A1J4KBD6_9EUKA|nr:hypothetical protein TRFO_04821 [Tritrichomonas foetus]|eukprot:OHT08727.1 hypothetical protein TRFO_04821 [Tritrichomonas foetus]
MRRGRRTSTETHDAEDEIDELEDAEIFSEVEFEPHNPAIIDFSSKPIPKPTSIKCDFLFNNQKTIHQKLEDDQKQWKNIIDNYFSAFSYFQNTVFSRRLYQKMIILAEQPNSDKIQNFILDKISLATGNCIDELTSSNDLNEFFQKVEKMENNIKLVSTIFQPISKNLRKVIHNLIGEHLINDKKEFLKDIISIFVVEFCQNQPDYKNPQNILFVQLFKKLNLYSKEIIEHFASSFIQIIGSHVQKGIKRPWEPTIAIFSNFCQLFPLGEIKVLNLVTESYLVTIARANLIQFINAIASSITTYFDDLYNFVYSTGEIDNTLNHIKNLYESIKLDVDEVIDHLNMFSSFPPDLQTDISHTIRKCLFRNDDGVAANYAEYIDRKFREINQEIKGKKIQITNYKNKSQNLNKNTKLNEIKQYGETGCKNSFYFDKEDISKYVKDLILFESREAFEEVHSALMLRRSLEISMIPDQLFTKYYRKNFGNCGGSIRFESILHDYHQSHLLVDEFKSSNNIPSYLNIYVFYSCNWSSSYRKLSILPDFLQEALNNFTTFFRKKNPKKVIEWSASLSNCEIMINDINITCNGIVASILHSLLNEPKTIDQINNETCLDHSEIEALLQTLRSEKCGKFITFNKGKYSINSNSNPQNNQISLPFLLPEAQKSEARRQKMMVITSRTRQIESAILAVLKGNQTIHQSKLFEKVQYCLQFTLDNDMFEERLCFLERRRYLKRNLEDKSIMFLP